MSAILPPAERLWYKHPIDRVEGTWIVIALTWCLIMFAMMVGWHIWGSQNLSTETYRTTPDKFTAKAQAHGRQVHGAHRDRREDPGGGAAGRQRRLHAGAAVELLARSSNWRRARPTSCT